MKMVRLFALSLGLVLVTVGVGVAQTRPPAEPAHEDRPLSDWVRDLKGGAAGQRARAAQALAEMGPRAETAVPALVEALKDPKTPVRRNAARALGRMGSGYPALESVAALTEVLEDRS